VTIGLFCEIDRDPVIVGRQVAVDALLGGLLAHGRERYLLFAPRMQLGALAPTLARFGDRVALHDRRVLCRQLDRLGLTAWHDSQLDCWRPFALRDRARVPYPVTVLHHSLSYKELLHAELLRLLLAGARPYDALICTSTAARRALEALLGHVAARFAAAHGVTLACAGRREVIPLGVDTERFRPGDRSAARARFELSHGAFVLLWVGRLSAIDKADLVPLCECFAELRRRNAGRELALVCAGRQRPGERFGDVLGDFAAGLGLADSVRVLTEVGDDLPELYAAADVLVSPVDSLQESFGLAPVEAMACGLPQIVSDFDGYRDTVVEGETGYLVPTCWASCSDDLDDGALVTDSAYEQLTLAQSVVVDMRALGEATQRLLDDEPLRRQLGEASRRRALACFALPVVAARYEALWAELAVEAARDRARPVGPSYALPSYALPSYAAVFSHYPTTMLGDATELRLTDRGRALMAGAGALPAHYDAAWGHLDQGTMQRALTGLGKLDRKGQSLSIGRIVAVIERATPGARPAVVRQLLWLMKYGYVERA
jgi:glycosyltransferase involved in cell wall biosynthesis